MDDFTEVTNLDELNQAINEANTAAEGFRERINNGERLTGEEIAELQGHFDRRDAARARLAEVEAEASAAEQEQAEVASRFDTAEEGTDAPAAPEAVATPPETGTEPVAVEVPGGDALAAALDRIGAVLENAPGLVASGGTSTTTTSPRLPRPEVPQAERALQDLQVTLTAAANTAGVNVGDEIGLDQAAYMAIKQAQGRPAPSGDGKRADWQPTPLMNFGKEFPEELQITEGKDAQKVFEFACDESRLPGGSLVAAGWCAPSEQLYDLTVIGESLDGMASTPEVQAKRAGIKHTAGPDFATLWAGIGFHQTEAQAIANTTKPCYDLPCPTFDEDRLEVEGVCIRVPILTYAAYPELVQRILSGAMVVHAHRINAFKLAKFEANSTAKTATDIGTVAETTLRMLELRIEYARQIYRMQMNETLEVKIPSWVRAVLKADLRLRGGNDATTVVDNATLDRHFASIGAKVEWVYDWAGNELGNVTAVPATYKALMYPAGTFLTLTNDVINLSSVYDAASLATNVYTGLFTEEGIQVAKMSGFSEVITMAIAASGNMGAFDLT